MICKTPEPPYYAVIFTSTLNEVDEHYSEMSELTEAATEKMEGYIGNEHFRNEDGFGIHVSYWKDMDSIKRWKHDELHKKAKQQGISEFYKNYTVRISKVEMDSSK